MNASQRYTGQIAASKRSYMLLQIFQNRSRPCLQHWMAGKVWGPFCIRGKTIQSRCQYPPCRRH